MPRKLSGIYELPAGNPVISGTIIESEWANTTMEDIAAALTLSLSRNGEGCMLAPLKLVDGSEASPGLAWCFEENSGLYRAADGNLQLAILGQKLFRWFDQAAWIWNVEKQIWEKVLASNTFNLDGDGDGGSGGGGSDSVGPAQRYRYWKIVFDTVNDGGSFGGIDLLSRGGAFLNGEWWYAGTSISERVVRYRVGGVWVDQVTPITSRSFSVIQGNEIIFDFGEDPQRLTSFLFDVDLNVSSPGSLDIQQMTVFVSNVDSNTPQVSDWIELCSYTDLSLPDNQWAPPVAIVEQNAALPPSSLSTFPVVTGGSGANLDIEVLSIVLGQVNIDRTVTKPRFYKLSVPGDTPPGSIGVNLNYSSTPNVADEFSLFITFDNVGNDLGKFDFESSSTLIWDQYPQNSDSYPTPFYSGSRIVNTLRLDYMLGLLELPYVRWEWVNENSAPS